MSEDCLNPLIAQMLQDRYEADRQAWREEYLAWLASRELPGSPVTPFVPDPLAAEPTTFDPILGSA